MSSAHLSVRVQCTAFYGGLEACSPRKFRPYESASEALHHLNHMATGVQLRRFIVWSPLGAPSLRNDAVFAFEALPQNCLLGVAVLGALCLQDLKQ